MLLLTQSLCHVRHLLQLVSACRERGKVQLTGQAWYKGAAVASPVSVMHHGAYTAGIHRQLQTHQDRHAQHAGKCPGTCKNEAASQPTAYVLFHTVTC